MPKEMMSRSVELALGMKLKELLIEDGEGYVRYPDGFSDERMAAEFSVTEDAINRYRRSVFGHIRPNKRRPYKTRFDGFQKQLATFEERQARDAKHIAELQGRLTALEASTSSEIARLKARLDHLVQPSNSLYKELSVR